MKIHVCDICKRHQPNANIKYKYRAKKAWYFGFDSGWNKIELCRECLDKIIEIVKED